MAKAKQSAARRRANAHTARRPGRRTKADMRPWALWTTLLIVAAAALRLGVNALGLVPVHFDEAQYWAYGHEFAWGHFSKPPLVGWVILATTWFGGGTSFWLRIGAVLAHAVIAALLYLTGARLWDGRTGFSAAAGYTAAPGVTASAMVISTDPVMMAFWAVALYAWVRAAEQGGRWWALMGVALGLGMLAKYTAFAFAVGALGYGLFSARDRDWRGVAVAGIIALAVLAPNLWWQAQNGFVTVGHVAEDAAPPGERYTLAGLGEFLGTQFGVIGPVWFLAILAALWWRREWLPDWRMRLLAWQTFTLLGAMAALAFYVRAQPNWAAPAYVAGALLAARVVLMRGWYWALPAQAAVGVLAAALLYVAAWAYAAFPLDLPRAADPFKKMRLGEPFCAAALGQMAEEGAEVLLSDDRRRLSECMFHGGLTFDEIAVWNPDLIPRNHHELVATLRQGDERPMLLAVLSPEQAEDIARRFDEAHEIEIGSVETHADAGFPYALWFVQGFRGY
jgi:4-amino-4-deoxy-L-arabinose transferase-like glycosyltransferase